MRKRGKYKILPKKYNNTSNVDGRNTRERIPNEKNEAIFLMAFKYLPFATSNSIVKDKQEILFIFLRFLQKMLQYRNFIKLMDMQRLSSMETIK